MLLRILEFFLLVAFLRFVGRLFLWTAQAGQTHDRRRARPPRRAPDGPRVIDVEFTEEGPIGKGSR